jgi:hypothetical protein
MMEDMANLITDFCKIEVKNPIGVTACDFGGNERLLRRCAEQGIGWIIGKTVHKIDGPHRWPRPYFYSLKRFGKDLADAWIPFLKEMESAGVKMLEFDTGGKDLTGFINPCFP